ncbi:hypothetical protein VTL71DRAFT_6594 [Oculimacula yallundae]|uniref:Xylanolytic transcriptional activator regulatory domain-containing protein n=1 Tax=Oculimacula yallundae TaxID=86028 RepID=A0ABR4BXG1_9HELO
MSECDLKYPNCSNCEGANIVCLSFHSGKQVEVPRNYLSSLEVQVEKLTRENEELQARAQMNSAISEDTTSLGPYSPDRLQARSFPVASPASSDASSTYFLDLVKSVKNVVVEPSRQPRFLGQSSGITLARLVMAAIRIDTLPAPLFSEQPTYDPSSAVLAAEVSLPPRHAANHLVEVYLQYRTPHLPILLRSEIEETVKSAYLFMSGDCDPPPNRLIEKDMFTAYMIFAIALFDVPNPSGGRPTQSEGCFRSAIGWIEKVITYSKSDIETLRSILLLAQFIALYPSRGSLWHLTGTALRLCIDIGLHWESEEHARTIQPDLLQERRRLWYSTYQLDRMLSITLGRPFGIIDESTCVPLPDPAPSPGQSLSREVNLLEKHNGEAYNHLICMSKLESEIKHVQHNQAWSQKIAYPRTNYLAWVSDIRPRLQEWYTRIPSTAKAHPSSIFACQAYWEATYNNALCQLYRPNATVLHSSAEDLSIFYESSCKLIASIKVLQREQKIDILWKTVHQLFMAGLGVVYGLWLSKEIRDQYPISKCISTLQTCASTLSALSESFPGAGGCRDAFESISSATIDWLVTSRTEDRSPNSTTFEKQVEDVLGQLHPPSTSRMGLFPANNDVGAGNLSNMLSNDAFSEMLASAAQWPEFQDMDFSIGDSTYNEAYL